MWQKILIGGCALLPIVLPFFLSRKRTKKWGRTLGILVSKFLRQKLGKGGEKAFETTIIDLMDGGKEGLLLDNEKKK